MLLDSNLISFLRFSDSQRTKRVINAFSIYVISPCGYVVCVTRCTFHLYGLAFSRCLKRHLRRGRYCKGSKNMLMCKFFRIIFLPIATLLCFLSGYTVHSHRQIASQMRLVIIRDLLNVEMYFRRFMDNFW